MSNNSRNIRLTNSRHQSTPSLPHKSRFAVRREELSKQEQLLLEKKKEVEAKLCSSGAGDSSDAVSVAASPPLPPKSAESVAKSDTPVLTNKFLNNGSFLEMFRANFMQEQANKTQDEQR